MEKQFRKGEIVWAKVKGFPWWPGRIKSVSFKSKENSDEDDDKGCECFYSVEFFGDDSHVELPSRKVENFNENYPLYSKTRQKKLLKSIESAKKLVDGEMNSAGSCGGSLNGNSRTTAAMMLDNDKPKSFLGRKTQKNSSSSLSQLKEIANSKGADFNDHPRCELYKGSNKSSKVIKAKACRKSSESKDKEEDKKDSDEDEDEETPEERLKKAVNSFLKYRIENSSTKREKFLLTAIEDIENNLKHISSSTYALTKDIISVLLCFTSDKSTELFIKSSQLIHLIHEKINKELFDMTSEELCHLSSENTSLQILSSTIEADILTFRSSLNESQNKKKRSRAKAGPSCSLPRVTSEKEAKQICERDDDINDMIQILNAGSYQKAMTVFELLSSDFFNNTYMKNTQLDKQAAKVRKYSCVKMKQKILQIAPTWDIDGIQRMVIYFEYKQRAKDLSLGKKYLQHLRNLFDVIESVKKSNCNE